MSELFTNVYTPDVLTCIANLSNDEVFTPPDVANKMLDLLPQELFESPDTRFLDPACKSGVFLREIAKRLIKGLESVIPDLEERLVHIFKNQIYGIAITELTSLISRRSLYCSKYASSVYSVVKFDNIDGNIRFKHISHTFRDGKCIFCGASESEYGKEKRGEGLESHAYEFIHTMQPEEILKMKFDVIIGNPPYQMSTAGSVDSQAIPLYNKFVEQSKKLNPRFLSMIIPSRWMNGGFALDDFRASMLNDKHITVLHDYLDTNHCFPGISLSGGVCYFLWDRDNQDKCNVFTHNFDHTITHSVRYLLENGIDTYIRFNEAISILEKVKKFREKSFSDIVSQRDPFGLNYRENGAEKMFKLFSPTKKENDYSIYYFGWQKKGINYTSPSYVTTNQSEVNRYKVFISKANGAASNSIPYSVLSQPFVGEPNSICNMTYLLIGGFDTENEANNVCKYISTKFFRFLVSLLKNTQNAYKKVYTFVPMQDFNKQWTDFELYQKYNLTKEEINFIESMIRPMDIGGDE